MERSSFTVDLGAIRHNAETLLRAADGAELWAVVKAEGYGHGAVDVSRAALEAGVSVLCVATLREALQLRPALRDAPILVMGPVSEGEIGEARAAHLELVVAGTRMPEGVPIHLKLDTGMGRWGLSELPAPSREVVGVMSHLASAESDPDFTRAQIERFDQATAELAGLTRHLANSAATLELSGVAIRRRSLRYRALRDLAVRDRPGRARSPPRAPLGLLPRADEAARPRPEHGVRPPLRRREADLDRHRPGRLRGRLSPRHDRDGGARRGGTAPCRRERSRWTRSPSSSPARCRRERRSRSSATASSSKSMPGSRTRSRTRSRPGSTPARDARGG